MDKLTVSELHHHIKLATDELIAREKPAGINLGDYCPHPNNQQRYELIQRAREFVEELKNSPSGVRYRVMHEGNYWDCDAEFIVNEEKRTVVCLLRGFKTKEIARKGIAKCMPEDVFNADIGKLIALYKALGKDIPQEFTHAVQPDEVVAGMEIETLSKCTGEIVRFAPRVATGINEKGYPTFKNGSHSSRFRIIDDTNAEYEAI